MINKIDPDKMYGSNGGGHVVADLGVYVALRAWNVAWSESAGRDIRRTLEDIRDRCKRRGGTFISKC